jgi:trimethylamine---corrinoid protein Co-methyltransferase
LGVTRSELDQDQVAAGGLLVELGVPGQQRRHKGDAAKEIWLAEDSVRIAGSRSRRSGGSAARRKSRAGGAATGAVRPGLAGGQYRPLQEGDIRRIYRTALDILENIGIGDPIPEILHYALPGGCILDDRKRLRFPSALVEDLIDKSARSYVLHAPDPARDMEVKDAAVLFCTSGEAVRILDYESQRFRPATLVDLYDAARLADQLEHIDSFGQPFIAADYSHDLFVHDMNIAYAALAGTRKALALGIATAEHIKPLIAMFDAYVGEEGGFLKRPFCTFGGCPIVSPLRFGRDNSEVLVRVAELGLTIDVAVAPQAGATGPAALAGTLAQCLAETLACLCITNLVRPGSVITFGMWPFISDLRTGSFSGGSGEEALVTAASVQICNYFGFISSVGAGMTDAKTVDVQSGYEKALTVATAALAGGNLIAAYPGIVGSLIGQSFEGMLIDNDMIGNVQRILRGIEVTDETLSYKVIEDVVSGAGHYLGHSQTLQLMESEYLYPKIADRLAPTAWEEMGSETLYQQAHRRVHEKLADFYPQYISAEADARIRRHFPIRLTREDMQPGNNRWYAEAQSA